MAKVYLDNSALNRPFDDQSVPRNRLEATAVSLIFRLIDKKKIKLINSSVIEYENSRNPFFERKIWVAGYLSKSTCYQKVNTEIKKRAEEIEKSDVLSIDSLHLASAESAKSDYFITCDERVIKKYRGPLKVINPVDFIQIFKSK